MELNGVVFNYLTSGVFSLCRGAFVNKNWHFHSEKFNLQRLHVNDLPF